MRRPKRTKPVLGVKVVSRMAGMLAISTLTPPLRFVRSGRLPRHFLSFPSNDHVGLFRISGSRDHRVLYTDSRASEIQELEKMIGHIETNINILYFLISFDPMKTILWEYRLNFSGLIEAPPSLPDARRILMEELRSHPERFISDLKPIEATDHMILDIGKRVLGLR